MKADKNHQGATATSSEVLNDTWKLHKQWSMAADIAKKNYVDWNARLLWMTIAAAFASALTGALPNLTENDWVQRGIAIASAIIAALLAFFRHKKATPDEMRSWIRARSISEGLKTEIYQYLTRTSVYREAEASHALSKRVEEITKAAEDLTWLLSGVSSPAAEPPPDPLSLAQYIELRVNQQIDGYYTPHAASEARIVKHLRSIELWLAGISAVLAAVVAAVGIKAGYSLAPWSAVMTTALAAVVAHLSVGRHEHQMTTYTATALRLRRLSSLFKDTHAGSPPALQEMDAFVAACESAISIENQGWMAEWEKPPK